MLITSGGFGMITRKAIIEYDVNEIESNEIYLDESNLEETNDGDINSILDMMYRKNGISPLDMTWELTDKCNFECPFCYIHNHSTNPNKEQFEYRFETIKPELDELINHGLFICYLSGGECLLHPDFEKIYLYLKTKGVLVAVLTNAALLSDDHVNIFRKYKPYKIEVSIYGVDTTFSKKTQMANKVLKNVLKLKNAGINVIAKMPRNNCTEREFEKVRAWCEKNDIEFFYSNELFNGYDDTDNSIYQSDIDERNDIRERKWGYKKVFDCPAGKHSFVLSYDGKVRPCFAFYEKKTPEWSFSIEHGIITAFNRMKNKVESISGKRLKHCKGCERSNQCQECIATQCVADDVESYMKHKCMENNFI